MKFLERIRTIQDHRNHLAADIRAYPATRSAARVILPARPKAATPAALLELPGELESLHAA